MSKTIDERVVEMRFDNKQFESGVKNTMSTLDKFKQSLKLKDATKGLDDLEKAAKKVDINPLGKAAETVSMKFSALQVAGVTALANITNSAVNAGKNIVKAFTLDPILTGFQEYETQINAVQTILANTESKGSTLQDVNAALNELNKYADMTIYNFTEMTRNIGTFTAAGVDLKTSVSAIKGIANLAAVSGSTSLQASTAMYQLSQALAAGKVQLMDWNSVVNAGMGGQVFQDALKETARVHGVAIDKMIKDRGSFRETLQDGWLTAEVLTETLSKFTGDLSAEQLKQMGYTEEQIAGIIKMGKTANDAATKVKTFTQLFDTLKEAAQSGWTRSWEIFIGDFGEAKEFLTSISDSLSDIINKSADARNSVLSGGLSSGWKQLLNAGIADEEGYKETLKAVVNEHGTSIDEMIKAEQKLDESLTDTEAFQKVLKKGFVEGTLTSDMFTESVHRMADKMSNMSAEELEAAGYTKDHIEQIRALSDGLKDGSISMDEFVKKMNRSSGRENLIEALWNSFDALLSVIKPIKEAFREIFPATTAEQLYSLTERIRDFTATLKLSDKQAANLKSTFKGIFSVINVGVTFIKNIIGGITTLIGKITGLSGDFLEISGSMGDWLSKMADGIVKANLFGKAIDKIVGFLGLAIDKFKEFTGAVKEKIDTSNFEWFFDLMKGIWDVIQRIGSAIGKVAAAIGGAIASAFRNGDIKSLLDILNGGLFATILLGIKKYISGITDTLDKPAKLIDNIKDILGSVEDSLKSWQQNLQSGTIKNIAIAIGILAASLWVISGIDSDKLGSALGAMGILFGELLGAMALFNKIGGVGKGAISSVTTMIGMAAAVLILTSALKKLADLKWEQLFVGLTGVTILIGAMTGAMIALSLFTSKSEKIFNVSKKGIFSKNAHKSLISVGLAMIAMAGAIKILASACKDLSSLTTPELIKGLTGVVVLLGVATGAMVALSKFAGSSKKTFAITKNGLFNSKDTQNLISVGLAMIAMAAAIKLLASACKDLSSLTTPELIKGLAGVVVLLGVATGAMIALSKFTSSSKKTFAITKKGLVSSKDTQSLIAVGVALIAMAGAMEIFADVANKFGEMKWENLGKAGAAITAVLGLAIGFSALAKKVTPETMMSAMQSLVIMGAAMEIFAHVAAKFAEMDWEQLGKAGAAMGGIIAIATGFMLLSNLVKYNMVETAASLLVMAAAFAVLTPVLMALGNMSGGQIATSLIAIAGGLVIFIGAAALIQKFNLIPAMYSMAGAIALVGAACLAAGIGVMAFAAGFTALAAAGAAGATAFVAAITVIIVGILQLIPSIVDQLTAAVVAICNVIIKSAPAIGEAIKALVLTAIDVLVECVPALTEGFLQLLIGVMEALVQYTPQVVDLLFDFILALINGVAARLPEYMGAVANLIVTFINGLAEHVPEFIAAGINLIGAIIQGIADAIGPILDILAGAITTVIDSIAQALPGLADVISACGETIRSTLSGIADVFDSVFGGISDVITSVGDSIRNVLDGIAGIIESIGKSALDAGTGFENLANGVKTITKLKLADMAASLAAVAVGMGKIAKHSKGLAEAGTGMSQIANGTKLSASAFDRMASGILTVITSLTKSPTIAEAMNSVMTNAINTITNSETKITTAVKSVLSASVTAIEASYSDYTTAGSYLVDGFAKGITDNTFKAEAKAKAMAIKALDAAKKALDEHSPSKKFAKVGAFAVAGFARGITKNAGDANKASVKMANGVLESTQDALGIHSPSVVFDKKVGRYIVQGIAEGITKDMSAEEAAEKKAQNIVSAFQSAIDRSNLAISNRDKDFELWGLTDGKAASDVVIAEKQRKKLNDDLWEYNQQVKFTTDKWIELKNNFGENSKYAEEARGAMMDAQIKAAETASELIALDRSTITNQEESIKDWSTINNNGLKILELAQANGELISDANKDKQYLAVYKDDLNGKKTIFENAKKYYEDMLAQYGDMNHSVVRAAKIAMQEAEENMWEAQSILREYEDSIVDREVENIQDNMSRREAIERRWEALNDDASKDQRYSFYKNMYTSDASDLWNIYRTYLNKYNEFVKNLAKKNNITIQEAKQTKEAGDLYNNELYPAYLDAIEGDKKVRDLTKDHLEQQKEDLKNQYELTSDIADLKYQIWEKTSGREATDTEKDTMKLAFLSEQLGAQAKLVKMAKKEWDKATDEDKYTKEKEYYSAQLELANLQSEVLDIQEANTKRQERALDRQRNAQSEYDNYLKKYEKYYLEHGMTLEELEKDAKLVSGYDPNNAVNSMISKTNNALNNLKSNSQYSGILSNFSDMGTTYASAVSEGIQNGISTVTDTTTTMLKSCVEVIDAKKESWTKAGVSLVNAFIEGIKSKINDAVNATIELASRALATIQSICDSDMDYNPRITPVLDMSNVSAGASQLNSMLSGKTTLGLASSIAKRTNSSNSTSSSSSQSSAPVYEFTQNNYSPKSLSSVEIYRQTKNMFTTIRKKG